MTPAAPSGVAAIILAAGASTRLGEPKQLVVFEGEQLLDRAIRLAGEAGCMPLLVVLGAGADVIQARLNARSQASAQIILNDRYEEGMGSSIRAGVAQVPADCAGVLILTCDQPLVTCGHLRDLTARSPAAPVASGYRGRRGVPAYFPRSCFGALGEVQGDTGARALLASAVTIDAESCAFDVDIKSDLEMLRTFEHRQ